jgi:TolA-binding protein
LPSFSTCKDCRAVLALRSKQLPEFWIALMPSTDLNDQDTAVTETKVSGLIGLPLRTARGLAAWVNAHRLQTTLIFGGGMSLLITAALVSWLILAEQQRRALEEPVTMKQVLQSLDSRAFDEAKSLANRLLEQGGVKTEDLGGPAFALGAAAAYEADNAQGKDRDKLFRLAIHYLEDAYNRGFPADRREEGMFLLGKSLYESGRIQAGISILSAALNVSPRFRTEILFMLANSYLNDSKPDLALIQNSSLLADDTLSETKRQEALLQRAQILLRLGKIELCNATLDQIPAGSKNPAVAVERGQVLMFEARELKKTTPSTADDQLKAREKLRQAIQTMRPERDYVKGADKSIRTAMYLSGICYLEMEDYQAALDQFIRTHSLFPDTPESAAADLQAAELYRRLGRDMDTLSEYRRVLGGITEPGPYYNPWMSLDRIKSSALGAYQYFLTTQKFEIALQLTRMLQPVCPADQVLQLQAETHAAWGQSLLNQADKGPRNKADFIRRLAREQLRRAGKSYASLSEILPANKNYSDQVWNSATSYLQGQDYVNAERMFQVYLKNEAQRRNAQALTYLGESLLAVNQLDKALEALKECIDLYPRDVIASHARLLAARAYEEKGDWRNAESLLSDNLNGDYLTPQSKEWRDSLFALGEMLHAEGHYAEAVRRLEEAAERYPDLPETIQARYLAANCYYKMASADQDKLNKASTGSSSAILAKQVQELFSKALTRYEQVQAILVQDREEMELTAGQKAILRNSYFAIGNVLYAQGDYEASLKAYNTAANRYQIFPEVLDAYVQIANIYRKLNKPQDAKNALQQAKFALGRIKADVAFEITTNYTRKQWTQRLDLLSSL